jgi:hypothetical protein
MAALAVSQDSRTANSSAVFDAATIIPLGNRPVRRIVEEPNHEWRAGVIDRLQELVTLPMGWDGYGGAPVSFWNATFALRMLETVCAPSSPVPQIVPGASGDLQIEWHTPAGDIELHVRGPNDVIACHGAGPELALTNNFIEVAAWVEALGRSRAAVAAA